MKKVLVQINSCNNPLTSILYNLLVSKLVSYLSSTVATSFSRWQPFMESWLSINAKRHAIQFTLSFIKDNTSHLSGKNLRRNHWAPKTWNTGQESTKNSKKSKLLLLNTYKILEMKYSQNEQPCLLEALEFENPKEQLQIILLKPKNQIQNSIFFKAILV